MDKEHTVRSFDEAMGSVEQDILRMGNLAISQLHDVIEALRGQDLDVARAVIEKDMRMDDLDDQVTDAVQNLLALRQPMARDMRALISCDRIATDLERIGDYLKSIAKRLLILLEQDSEVSLDRVLALAEMVVPVLRQAIVALENRDAPAAAEVLLHDDNLDRAYERLAEGMTDDMCRQQSSVSACMQLLFIAKAIERVGDHATNISEDVLYWVTGERPVKRRLVPAG